MPYSVGLLDLAFLTDEERKKVDSILAEVTPNMKCIWINGRPESAALVLECPDHIAKRICRDLVRSYGVQCYRKGKRDRTKIEDAAT
ncbi:MAG: hypothetical protein QHI38_00970 [Armatimonadota bacterium]|nr:hypothetical protein [Armatimonadota bacterium]